MASPAASSSGPQALEASYDAVIIGAGISGIIAAYRLQQRCPGATYVVLERRAQMGGTWDLFRYPGIRSDSDMFSFGFPFRRWTSPQVLGTGADILEYMAETAKEFGIDRRMRFRCCVSDAAWSSETQRWSLTVAETHKEHDGSRQGHEPARDAPYVVDGTQRVVTAQHLIMATGYYSYDKPYRPHFPGEESFKGDIVHPQFWDPKYDYQGKRVVVIGSGATAITVVPTMAFNGAQKVTLLQRSPTYIAPQPARSKLFTFAQRWLWFLPTSVTSWWVRWYNMLMSVVLFQLSRRFPWLFKSEVAKAQRMAFGCNETYEAARPHLTPRYEPWDQRVCVAPEGDLFLAMKQGKAEMVTDTIQRFTETGIELDSGRHIDADVIVPATGLTMQFRGGIAITVDGKAMESEDFFIYRGCMFNGVPNFYSLFGSLNASWAMKADLIGDFAARVIARMRQRGQSSVTPTATAEELATAQSALGHFSSGYLKRCEALVPRQGAAEPWRSHHNFLRDFAQIRLAPLDDSHLVYRH